MIRINRTLMPLLMLAFCLLVLDPVGEAGNISNRRIRPCRIEQAGAYHALAEISSKAGIPIGVEAVQPASEPDIVIDFPGGTAADLLNAFVAQAPDYRWTESDDGIVHVTRGTDHITLLDVFLNYPGAAGKTRQQIWEDLSSRPEISAWISSAHCSRGELFHGGEFKTRNGPITIPAGQTTVRQLLDDVSLKSGENYWAVLESPPTAGSCRIAILLW